MPVATLLLALMHDGQLDEALAANSLHALAHLCFRAAAAGCGHELLANLASPLPLQLLATGLRRLPALKPIPPAESAKETFPDWLEHFVRIFTDYAMHRDVSNSDSGCDSVLGSVEDALAPCACSLVRHVARLLSAGTFPRALTYIAVSMLTRCVDKLPRSCAEHVGSMPPEGVPSAAGLANAAAALAEAFGKSYAAITPVRDPDFQRDRAKLLAATLTAGAKCARALGSDPGCLQRGRAQAVSAAPGPGGSSASALASEASLQQLQQAADVFRLGTSTARACCPDEVDDLRTDSLEALTAIHQSGAILRATAAAACLVHAAPAAWPHEAVVEPPSSAVAVAAAPPAGGTAPGSPSNRISAPSGAANAPAGASSPAVERVGPVLIRQERAADSSGGVICHPSFPPLARLHSRLLKFAGVAAQRCAQQTGVPHAHVLRLLGALLGLICDASGDSCGFCGPEASHFEARLAASACALFWLEESRDDLPEVRCTWPPSSHQQCAVVGLRAPTTLHMARSLHLLCVLVCLTMRIA